jgi:hypothetical protein
MNIKTLTRFGRSFSLLKIPYSFKLLIQELLVLNVQMRLITDDNVDQLMNMSYSTNINKLLQDPDEDLSKVINKYVNIIKTSTSKNEEGLDEDNKPGEGWDDKAATPMSDVSPTSPEIPVESPEYPSVLPPTPASDSPLYQPATPEYAPPVSDSPPYAPTSPDYPPPATPEYQPATPDYPPPATPEYQPTTPDYPPPATPEYQPTTPDYPPPPSDENKQLNALGNSMPTGETSVLDVQEEKPDVAKEAELEGGGSSSESKKIIINIKQEE